MKKYICTKCSNNQYELGEIRVAGSLLTKIFNIQNKKYTAVTCKKCGYTDFYKTTGNSASDVLDFFVG